MKYKLDDMKYLDSNYKFINLIYDFSFKYVMCRNLNLIKKFFINCKDLEIDVKEIKIVKYIDYDFILRINNDILISISMNNINDILEKYLYDYKKIGVKYIFVFCSSDRYCDDFFLISSGSNYCKVIIRYIKCYKDNYNEMSFDEVFMSGLCANSYTELYGIMSNILSNRELDYLIDCFLEMSQDRFILSRLFKIEMIKLIDDRYNNKIKEIEKS